MRMFTGIGESDLVCLWTVFVQHCNLDPKENVFLSSSALSMLYTLYT